MQFVEQPLENNPVYHCCLLQPSPLVSQRYVRSVVGNPQWRGEGNFSSSVKTS